MNADDLQRFAEDLRLLTGLTVDVRISTEPDSLHILRINGADFFFHADGSGYDGWGKALSPASLGDAQVCSQATNHACSTSTRGRAPHKNRKHRNNRGEP